VRWPERDTLSRNRVVTLMGRDLIVMLLIVVRDQ
jgi:hypothetical protein